MRKPKLIEPTWLALGYIKGAVVKSLNPDNCGFFVCFVFCDPIAAGIERVNEPFEWRYRFLAFWLRSSGGSDGKCLSTMRETWAQSLGRKVPWRKKWQPNPVLLPRKSHGWRTPVGYSPEGRKELDTTEWLHFTHCLALALYLPSSKSLVPTSQLPVYMDLPVLHISHKWISRLFFRLSTC